MSLVYLYTYNLPVQLSMTNHGAPNLSRPMYNYHVKVYKNNWNTVDFVVRNNDKKPVKLLDCVVTVTIQHVESGHVVLQKQAEVTNEVKGRAQLKITPSETENWLLGGYLMQISLRRPAEPEEFLYVDVNNLTALSFEVLPSLGKELVPSSQITFEQFTPRIQDWDSQIVDYRTGALAAQNAVGSKTGFFSVVIYTDQFSGTFACEASLENLAPTSASWFPVNLIPDTHVIEITPESPPTQCFNFSLNVNWIRFIVAPHVDNLGKFQKVLYKIT